MKSSSPRPIRWIALFVAAAAAWWLFDYAVLRRPVGSGCTSGADCPAPMRCANAARYDVHPGQSVSYDAPEPVTLCVLPHREDDDT